MSSSLAAAKPFSANTSSAASTISAGRASLRLRHFGSSSGIVKPLNDSEVIWCAPANRQVDAASDQAKGQNRITVRMAGLELQGGRSTQEPWRGCLCRLGFEAGVGQL